ncbi:MAG: threonine synthase [Deltaproteobacteria bacterium]|nr:threonine synthase [Deltaproteobacteria bacterium]
MFVETITCPRCDTHYSKGKPLHTCSCGSPLLVQYDLNKVKQHLKKETLDIRKNNLWRYRELLPLKNEANIVSLGEGMTPLITLSSIGTELNIPRLFMKDEGAIPTGTFKARGAAVGVSMAKELGIQILAMPTNGTAGTAWSAYCAAAGIKAVIVMPMETPITDRKKFIISGAHIYLVNGLTSDTGQIASRAIMKYGWYDASTLKEPYRIEGKKTIAFEIVEQLGWIAPDVIIAPAGGGAGIIGVHKGLKEFMELGLIENKMPRLVAVQSSGCAPIVRAWDDRAEESQFWDNSKTIASDINVPKALGDFLVLDALHSTHGCALAVCDSEILLNQRLLSMRENIFACPEGAATLAAAAWLRKRDWISPDETVVLLNTGTGLKYSDMATADPPIPAPDEKVLSL